MRLRYDGLFWAAIAAGLLLDAFGASAAMAQPCNARPHRLELRERPGAELTLERGACLTLGAELRNVDARACGPSVFDFNAQAASSPDGPVGSPSEHGITIGIEPSASTLLLDARARHRATVIVCAERDATPGAYRAGIASGRDTPNGGFEARLELRRVVVR